MRPGLKRKVKGELFCSRSECLCVEKAGWAPTLSAPWGPSTCLPTSLGWAVTAWLSWKEEADLFCPPFLLNNSTKAKHSVCIWDNWFSIWCSRSALQYKMVQEGSGIAPLQAPMTFKNKSLSFESCHLALCPKIGQRQHVMFFSFEGHFLFWDLHLRCVFLHSEMLPRCFLSYLFCFLLQKMALPSWWKKTATRRS